MFTIQVLRSHYHTYYISLHYKYTSLWSQLPACEVFWLHLAQLWRYHFNNICKQTDKVEVIPAKWGIFIHHIELWNFFRALNSCLKRSRLPKDQILASVLVKGTDRRIKWILENLKEKQALGKHIKSLLWLGISPRTSLMGGNNCNNWATMGIKIGRKWSASVNKCFYKRKTPFCLDDTTDPELFLGKKLHVTNSIHTNNLWCSAFSHAFRGLD